MSLTVVIDTAAGIAENTISSGGVPYRLRAYALRNWILPLYIQNLYIDQLIVVGVWEEGDGYEYVHCPADKHHNGVDALVQRQAGFEAATGDVLVFQHDDHYLDDIAWTGCQSCIHENQVFDLLAYRKADVISPARYTRCRNVNGERINGGEANDVCKDPIRHKFLTKKPEPDGKCWCVHNGHINGHCAIYRREVIERCPWGELPEKWKWDMIHTAQIQQAGFKIEWTDAIKCWDVELGARL